MPSVTFRVDSDTHQRMIALCALEEMNTSDWLRSVIDDALEASRPHLQKIATPQMRATTIVRAIERSGRSRGTITGLVSSLDVPVGGNSPKPGSRLKQDKRK